MGFVKVFQICSIRQDKWAWLSGLYHYELVTLSTTWLASPAYLVNGLVLANVLWPATETPMVYLFSPLLKYFQVKHFSFFFIKKSNHTTHCSEKKNARGMGGTTSYIEVVYPIIVFDMFNGSVGGTYNFFIIIKLIDPIIKPIKWQVLNG